MACGPPKYMETRVHRGVGLLAYTRPRSARVAGCARVCRPPSLQYEGVFNGARAYGKNCGSSAWMNGFTPAGPPIVSAHLPPSVVSPRWKNGQQ